MQYERQEATTGLMIATSEFRMKSKFGRKMRVVLWWIQTRRIPREGSVSGEQQ